MEKFDIIILGGGASGLMCAISAAPSGKKILIIDKASSLGKKLMVTGNGRCNLSFDKDLNENDYNQNLDKYFKILSSKQTIALFNNWCLVCYTDEEGRVYPYSNNAKSVIDVLNNKIENYKNISKLLNTTFEDVEYKNGYIIKTSNGSFFTEKLVVALGGKSGENILNQFNIKTKPFVESLVALKTQTTKYLEGIRISPVKLTIKDNTKIEFCEIGEVLFKDSGISGILAFNASSYFARKGIFDGEINIDIMPNLNKEKIKELLIKRKSLNLPINKMFDGIFMPQIAYFILNLCKIDENRTTIQLKNDEIELIVNTIKNIKFKIKSHYNNNQVYSGGVLLPELTDSLESKKQKNLFFCGEICDVDGKCGGYNLQWAWTSGYIAGVNL